MEYYMEELKKKENGFYLGDDPANPLAEILYKFEKDTVISVYRTFVSDTLRGQGIAGKLLKKVIDLARQENLKIIPACSYAEKVMTQNPEYKDLLAE